MSRQAAQYATRANWGCSPEAQSSHEFTPLVISRGTSYVESYPFLQQFVRTCNSPSFVSHGFFAIRCERGEGCAQSDTGRGAVGFEHTPCCKPPRRFF